MSLMTLPPERHTCLISFWLAGLLAIGLLSGAVAARFMSMTALGCGSMLALAVGSVALLWPERIAGPYRLWNRVARAFARRMRTVLLGICFYVIFVAVGRAGSSLLLARLTASESTWVPRGTLARDAYGNQHAMPTKAPSRRGWPVAFLSWSVRSGNWWACSLLPFLILLLAYESEQEHHFPEGIYTLF